ncbi:hypothetical protein D3C73_642450 [compost metagenome]
MGLIAFLSSPFANILHSLLRTSEITDIKIPLMVEHFCMLKRDLRAHRCVYAEVYTSHHILSHIQYGITCWCHPYSDWLNLLCDTNEFIFLHDKHILRIG